MKINTNLSTLKNYKVSLLINNIKRCHANESSTTILPLEILMHDISNDLNYYPEEIYEILTTEASKFYKTHINYIIPVNGSDEGLDLIIRTFCNQNDNIAILNPTFSMYEQYATAFGLNVCKFDLNQKDFSLNINNFINFCQQSSIKMIIIPNPLSPTAGVTKREDLIKIISELPNTFVVIDEAYIEFSSEISMINLISQYANLIVTRTLSKFYGLAGIRLGFVITQLKSDILKIKAPYNVNTISCKIGINLFQNLTEDILKNRYNQNLKDRQALISLIGKSNEVEKIYDSHTNFLFIKLNCDANAFANTMINKYSIKIKAFDGEFQNFCRINSI